MKWSTTGLTLIALGSIALGALTPKTTHEDKSGDTEPAQQDLVSVSVSTSEDPDDASGVKMKFKICVRECPEGDGDTATIKFGGATIRVANDGDHAVTPPGGIEQPHDIATWTQSGDKCCLEFELNGSELGLDSQSPHSAEFSAETEEGDEAPPSEEGSRTKHEW